MIVLIWHGRTTPAMVARKRIRTCLCLLLAGFVSIDAGTRAQSDRRDFQAVDEFITAKMRFPRIPGLALAVVGNDQIIYAKGYGQADPLGRPVTPKTPFMIGSITKPFTALAVMQLVEAGKVELDSPVQKYLPWFRVADPVASAEITVRHLMTMTSGIPQGPTLATWTWPDEEGAIERHVRLLANVRLREQPGRSFAYSNSSYVTLGAIIQSVSGQTYEEYLRTNIFLPLDMKLSFTSQAEAMRNGMATGYRWWFGFPFAATLPFNRSNLPAGYIISSAEDMAKFLIAQMNGGRYRGASILSPGGIALTHDIASPEMYGLGWESVRANGRTLINHDGGTANFQAAVFFDPRNRIGVFIAANVVNALDAFSSPHGVSPLDGPTVRAMAESVLCLVANEPLPGQGPGIRRLTALFDLVILVLTGAIIASIARIPRRQKKLIQQGIPHAAGLFRRCGLVFALHFLWPALVLFLTLKVPVYRVDMMMFQPDLGYWLLIAGIIVFLKGVLEIKLIGRVFKRTQRNATARTC